MNVKGQSTVEYILLVTAVIATVIIFSTGSNSPLRSRLGGVFNQTTDQMQNVATRLSNAF